MIITDKIMAIHKTRSRFKTFNKIQMQEFLDNLILQILDGIVSYKCQCLDGTAFDMTIFKDVTDVEKQTPPAFQERFNTFMGMLDPMKAYVEIFIKREHPEMAYMVSWLFSLYYDENLPLPPTRG